MKQRIALYALAAVVLIGSMAVAALADDQRVNAPGPANSSVSSQQEPGMEQGTEPGMEHQSAGEIREPVETGAVPGVSVKQDRGGWENYQDVPPETVKKDHGGWENYQDVPPQN